jgi:hypothetical protein
VSALREDALSSTPEGYELRLGLPWIRSMPLSGVSRLRVCLDGRRLDPSEISIVLGSRRVRPESLVDELGVWWYLQDRLVITGPTILTPGRHHVAVDFRLLVPYLSTGSGGPLVLPIHLESDLEVNRQVTGNVACDVQ